MSVHDQPNSAEEQAALKKALDAALAEVTDRRGRDRLRAGFDGLYATSERQRLASYELQRERDAALEAVARVRKLLEVLDDFDPGDVSPTSIVADDLRRALDGETP